MEEKNILDEVDFGIDSSNGLNDNLVEDAEEIIESDDSSLDELETNNIKSSNTQSNFKKMTQKYKNKIRELEAKLKEQNKNNSYNDNDEYEDEDEDKSSIAPYESILEEVKIQRQLDKYYRENPSAEEFEDEILRIKKQYTDLSLDEVFSIVQKRKPAKSVSVNNYNYRNSVMPRKVKIQDIKDPIKKLEAEMELAKKDPEAYAKYRGL